FGRPENLDFAISTPDDDILYIVDAEQKEACFASGRNSKQGMLHVYRVGTSQAPVMITLFKGTYACAFDQDDRKARIIVEDMLRQEQVADVRTDMNGNYALSVPRAGRYRYRVECGPTGRTHYGVVDVPKADGPRAYRQELILERKGDLEQLTIRSYFDEPLPDDMIALALDEIKRRARLDVTGHDVVANAPEPAQQPVGDIMTRAGFTGDIDQAAAVRLAQDDARELEALAMDQQAQAAEAFTIAMDAANEADKAVARADELARQAAAAPEEQRNRIMTEAARERQRAREAALRARAAHATGIALSNAALATRQQAIGAAKLHTDLAGAIQARNDDAALPHLRALKQRLDEKARPDASREPAEQARRALAEQEKETDRLLGIAKSKRDEEGEVADRIARLKRERDEARSRSKKEDIDRQIAELEQQQRYLREETQAAVNKAAAAERQTAALRGQASLTRHLAQTTDRSPGTELTAEQAERLGIRISSADQRAAAIPIDERFDALVLAERDQPEVHAFDWDLASAAHAIGDQRTATRAMERDTQGDAQPTVARPAELPAPAPTDRSIRAAQVPSVPPAHHDDGAMVGEEAAGKRPSDDAAPHADSSAQPAKGADRAATTAQAQPAAADTRIAQASGTAARPDARAAGTDAPKPGDTGPDRPIQQAARASAEAQLTPGAQPGIPGQREALGDTRFLLENERAELQQLAAAERSKARRDSIARRIAQIDAELARADTPQGAAPQDEAEPEIDLSRPAAAFPPSATDEDIIALVHRDYAADLERAKRLPDADERADAINGIELMLADSLRAEQQRQLAVLELAPQQAEAVLPRINRLRQLREEHMAMGAQALARRQAEVAAFSTGAPPGTAAAQPQAAPDRPHPILERYVAIDRSAENVLASKVEHRSRAKGVDDAIAFRDADLARIDALTGQIDSMEARLGGMPAGKDFDKLRKKADQLIDERYIIRTDLGQRSAFLMREEWKAALDSLKRTEALVSKRGLAADEPLAQMAREFQADAKGLFEGAQQLRKRADRSDDIVLRDSLYRRAYREELRALQAVDKSITVQNYLAGGAHQRGERLAYDEVAARVLGIAGVPEPELAHRGRRAASEDGAPDVPPAARAPQAADGSQAGGSHAQDRAEPANAAAVLPAAPAATARQDDAPSAGNGPPMRAGEAAQAAVAQADRASLAQPPQGAREAEAAAQQAIASAEQRLAEKDRVPARLYERFLAGETAMLAPSALEPGNDPDLLALRAERAQREAEVLEQRSVQAADRAAALADSAAGARKRDRERLERLAARERAISDSLHAAALGKSGDASGLQRMADESAAAKALRERLLKFYYLAPEELRMAMLDADASRYFQARARALEQRDAADAADASAKSHREVAEALRQQAGAAERQAAQGGMAAADAARRAQILQVRVAALGLRADSLDNAASRLRGAAGINEAQAAAILQGLPDQRATELMALEQRARRSDALIAEQRGQAARTVAEPAAIPTLGRPAGAAAAPSPPASQPVLAPGLPISADDKRPAGMEPSPAQPFRMPDELVEDIFFLSEPSARRTEPIPLDAPLPQGIVFKVQVGAFRKPVPPDAFSDMGPLMAETVGNGLVRYTAGLFTSAEGALAAKELVRERGYGDAFVVAYRDGQRVPLGQAMREARSIAAATRSAQADEPAQRIAEAPAPQPAPPAAAIARPVEAQPMAEPDAAAILLRYPATADEVLGAFAPAPEATAYYNVPGAAPATQVEAVKGLFFTVQVGVYSKPVPLDKLFGITPLNSELTENAKVRYTTGRYRDMDGARARKDQAVAQGVKDAFITAYLNGKRIPVREASALLERFGPAILAQP
ncbi:MAG: hypothetical protein ACK4L7_00075, partial [Flavobacteriales bacterium]